MIKWALLLLLLPGLTLISCVAGEPGNTLLTPAGNLSTIVPMQETPPPTNSLADPTRSAMTAPDVYVKTDRDLYKDGESVIVMIENNTSVAIHFMQLCSLQLCIRSSEDWICEERECDGPMTTMEPGERLEILQGVNSIGQETIDVNSRYKLDYQLSSEEPFYFAYSNEFTVQGEGLNCKPAKQTALDHAQSSPYWNDIDASRATVRWQGENQVCIVDIAWQDAEQIRTGLWSEGYSVLVEASSGQVIEANAYER